MKEFGVEITVTDPMSLSALTPKGIFLNQKKRYPLPKGIKQVNIV
jgi:hypothetical protein